jgi:hypothetical protein
MDGLPARSRAKAEAPFGSPAGREATAALHASVRQTGATSADHTEAAQDDQTDAEFRVRPVGDLSAFSPSRNALGN